MKAVIIFFIRLYQKGISPFLMPRCRFFPTCSQYAVICFKKFSLVKALQLTIKRLLRCHPLCVGGYDPVPNKDEF